MQPTQGENGHIDLVGALTAKLESLRARVEQDQKDIAVLERSIVMFTPRRVRLTPAAQAAIAANAEGLWYANLKAQAAVEKLLRDNPDRAFGAGEAQAELLRHGFRPSTEHVGSQIAGALVRAVEKKIATRTGRPGDYHYQFTEGGSPLMESKNAAPRQG